MDSASVLPTALVGAKSKTLNAMGLLSAVGQLTSWGDIAGVSELYRVWLENNADDPLSYAMSFNYAAILSNAGENLAAKAALEFAIQRNPGFIPPYINLGHVLEKLGDIGAGVKQWYKVIEILGQVHGESITHKVAALKQIGRLLEQYQIDENAEDALRLCLDINANQSDVIQHWVSLRQRQCKWPVISPWGQVTKEQLLKGISSLSLAAHTDDPLMQLANAAHYCKNHVGYPGRTYESGHARLLSRAHPRRRKVGYLSSDLREHAIGFLTAELYEVHDRANVEVFLYYCGHQVTDSTHQRIKAAADHWIDLGSMTDEQAAERMAADGIEILVDVNGYTHSARIKLLSMRPAPIIVNWLGFPGSLGTPSHHYIIADEFIIPRESEVYYAENVLRLPCYQPNDRKRVISPRLPTRQEVGLPDDGMVFCCFNGLHKITPFTWARWMTILKQVPGSVLWLLASIETVSVRLKKQAELAGVDPARIIFAPKAKNPDHLARYPLADLFLDTTPYGAHTTSSDALWMGVPVLTYAGRSFASRVCGSLLKSAGLSELICSTPERYVSMAIELGANRAALQALRNKLVTQRDTCVLFDTPLLASRLEGLYAEMWADYVGGRLPRPDLTNLDIYNEIGCELDSPKVELAAIPNYREIYQKKLAERHSFSFMRPDGRLWLGEATAVVSLPAPTMTTITPSPANLAVLAPVSIEVTAESLVKDATAALAKGQADMAERLLGQALGMDAQDVTVLDMAARVALMRNKLDLAEALARQALAARPIIPVGLTLAEVMKAQGKLAGATKFFRSVLETSPAETRALIGLGEIQETAGDRKGAIELYRAALVREPTNLPLAVRYARILPIAQLGQGLAALVAAQPPAQAGLPTQLAYLNQLAPYREWAERAKNGQMPYHATSLSELYFKYAEVARDDYERVADAVLSQNPQSEDAIGAKAVCLMSRGRRADAEILFARMAQRQPGRIYDNITFKPEFFDRLAAMTDGEMKRVLPPVATQIRQDFADDSIIYLSCNYDYFKQFTRPFLMSINDVSPGAQVHLHIMEGQADDVALVVAFCRRLTSITVALTTENPDAAAQGMMAARCYYHAIRLIRMYQHLQSYQKTLWLMDVDALLHRNARPMLASIAGADVALRIRPGRWEPWNQFNASVVGVRPTSQGLTYLKTAAAFVAHFHNHSALSWGIDQLALYAAFCHFQDVGQAPTLRLLDNRAVDYEYYDDGFVWCNSGVGKFSQPAAAAGHPPQPDDLPSVRYFAAFRHYQSLVDQ
jgi:predicted O-linked N-acetylglucosamine transferase (SPINDLY family)